MLDIDAVLYRVLQLPGFEGKRPAEFIPQVIGANYSLAALSGGTYGSVSNQTMQFPTGAIICGMTGGASVVGAASTVITRAGLDMFTISINYNQQRTVVGPGQVLASTLLGPFNDLFPIKEIIVPTSGSLLLALTSVVSDAINVWVDAHCLVYNQIQ